MGIASEGDCSSPILKSVGRNTVFMIGRHSYLFQISSTRSLKNQSINQSTLASDNPANVKAPDCGLKRMVAESGSDSMGISRIDSQHDFSRYDGYHRARVVEL